MALGKAFIEVHADTAPFARELGRELDKIIKAHEKTVRVSATRLGETITKGVGDGIKRNKNQLGDAVKKTVSSAFGQDLGRKFTVGIIDALDDGLSGLPAEVKLALGAAVVGILPFVGAAVSGLVGAIVATAFAGLGLLVGSQFVVVQSQFEALAGELRGFFVGLGNVFVEPIITAFGLIRERVFALEGWFREVFAVSATFIEPLTQAVLGFVEGLLPGLLDSLRNIQPVVDELAGAGRILGQVIGEALEIITATGSADEGFRDLITVLGVLILSTAIFIRSLTEIYGLLRRISLVLSGPQGMAQLFAGDAAEAHAEKVRNAADANGVFGNSLNNLIAPTEREEQAMAELNQQIDQLTNLMFSAKNNEIAFEEGLDRLTESVKENGRSLKITGEAGRANAQILLNLAQVALKTRADTIALTGETDKANTKFAEQKAAIYALATQMKLSKTDTDNLIGALLNIPPPQPSGVDQATLTRIRTAIALATTLVGKLGAISRIGLQAGVAHIQAHAKGGVFSSPHVGLVAEAGPEAIIPLNNPARAAQVMNDAGLSGMTSPTVNVYIGNQQIDAYIDSRVNARMTVTARELAYGGRGV